MAGEVPPLNVEILVQLSNLTAAVQEATAGLNKIGDAAKEQEPKFSALKTTMLGVFAGNLMAQGTQILIEGLHSAVKAIEDTQVATEQLSTAMNNAKQNTAANREQIQSVTEKMSSLGFSTASTESAYTKLISATGSVTESTKLMSMAADLARYKHEDLATAAMTLEKGTMGNAKAFREFGITLDATLPKNQAIAKAMDELNQKIGGQAVGYTQTFAGQMEVLKSKFDDVAVKVGAVVMPILTKLMEFISGVIVPGIEWLYNVTIGNWLKQLINLWNTHEGLRKVVVSVVESIVGSFGYLLGAVAKVVDTIAKIPILGSPFKALGKGIDEAALSVGNFAKGLDSLANKKITLPSVGDALKNSGSTGEGGDVGVSGGLGAAGNINKAANAAEKALTAHNAKLESLDAKAAAAAEKALAARNAKIKTYNDEAIKLHDDMNAVLLDRQQKMDAATKTSDDALLKAQTTFNDAKANIETQFNDAMDAAQKTHDNAVENATTTHEENLLSIRQQYADKATQLQVAAADKQKSIIQQSIDVMTSAFASATKIDLGKLFTTGGSTASGLVTQLQDQLGKIVQLQKDAGKLAAAGYNQEFINEVISQGPAQGDALAQAVLTAAPDAQSSIKQLYSQVQDASQNGVTDLATQMNNGVNFANQALAKQFAQVNVDLNTQLADNSASLNDALTQENDKFNAALTTAQDTFNKATTAATNARDLALNKANDTLSASIVAAHDAFNKSIQSISDSSMKQLDALQTKLDATVAKIQALNSTSVSAGDTAAGLSAASTYQIVNQDKLSAGKAPVTYNVYNNQTVTGVNLADPNAAANALKVGTPLVIPPTPMKVG